MTTQPLQHIDALLSDGHSLPLKKTDAKFPSQKILLWLVLVSIVMMFAGLTSAYIVRESAGNWVHFNLPRLFSLSTSVILLSSLTMNWAVLSAGNKEFATTRKALLLTLVLGLAFVVIQFFGWKSLTEQGVFLVGNPSGSFLYVITGLHAFHVLGGMIALGVASTRSFSNMYDERFQRTIKLCSTYWHFVDGLWVYLFVFFLFFR